MTQLLGCCRADGGSGCLINDVAVGGRSLDERGDWKVKCLKLDCNLKAVHGARQCTQAQLPLKPTHSAAFPHYLKLLPRLRASSPHTLADTATFCCKVRAASARASGASLSAFVPVFSETPFKATSSAAPQCSHSARRVNNQVSVDCNGVCQRQKALARCRRRCLFRHTSQSPCFSSHPPTRSTLCPTSSPPPAAAGHTPF